MKIPLVLLLAVLLSLCTTVMSFDEWHDWYQRSQARRRQDSPAFNGSTSGLRPPWDESKGNQKTELFRLRHFLKDRMKSSGSPWLGHSNTMAVWFHHVIKSNYTVLMDLLSCDTNPCQNNGTCLDLRGTSVCYCKPEFTGNLCDRKNVGICKKYWCSNKCSFGRVHNDTHDCLNCQCKENPCKSTKCPAGEECGLTLNRCDPADRNCHKYTASCNAKVTCESLICRLGCQYGYQRDSNGCMVCKCEDNPCMDVKCESHHKCVAEEIYCKGGDSKCISGRFRSVCRAFDKPGICRADVAVATTTSEVLAVPSTMDLPITGRRKKATQPFVGNSTDIYGSFVSPAEACLIGCQDDSSCPGLLKCCSNGCGTECQKPAYIDDSPCPLHREEAMQNNMSLYIPECSAEGLFKPKQCLRNDNSNASVCACVNVMTGMPYGDSLLVDGDHNCTARSKKHVMCPQMKCSQFCQFGTRKDTNGCETCLCDDDPCKRHVCKEGQVCELIKFRCWKSQCRYEPHCVDDTWEDDMCPDHGKVLRTESNQLPVTCWNNNNYYGGSRRERSVCPKTHYCRKMTERKRSQTGVCCPVTDKSDKPGVCPSKDTTLNKYHFVSMYRGSRHCYYNCRHDGECEGIQKCCPSPYGCGLRCAMPMPSVNATCHTELREAILIAKVHSDSPLFMPRCHFNGTWQSVQCYDQYGICWCAEEDGTAVPGTHTRGIPDCSKPSSSLEAQPKVCPDGETVHLCSLTQCLKAICPAVPHAVCRINPCGGCKPEFHDKDNNIVDCTQGISVCERSNMDHFGDIATQPIYTYPYLMSSEAEHIFHVNSGRDQLEGANSTHIDDGYLYPGIMPYYQFSRYSWRSKRAYCPSKKSINGPCYESCQENKDCALGLMCCSNRCGGKECVPPRSQYERCLKEKEKSTCDDLAFYLEVKGSFYFDSQNFTCSQYEKPICEMNEGKSNRFHSLTDCRKNCLEIYPMSGSFHPYCVKSPDPNVVHRIFSTTQCLDAFCWCVLPSGEPVEGTLTKGEVECDDEGKIEWSSGPQSVCPDGSVPKICAKACHQKSCESDVWATCRTDPCDNCKVTFVDSDDNPVTCQEKRDICSLPLDRGHCSHSSKSDLSWYYDAASGLCRPFTYSGCGGNANRFYSKATCVATCQALVCDRKKTVRLCPDGCHNATCQRFPEALCIMDPCTCKPIFVDLDTRGAVQCNHITTICQRMRAENLRMRMLTQVRPEAVHVVECETDGSFKAMQCSDHHKTCWCVDSEGYTVAGTTKSMGDNVKPICVKEKTTEAFVEFRIDGDYKEIVDSVDDFKSAWMSKIVELMQISEANIGNFDVRPGSIIVSFTVVSDGKTDLDSSVEYVREAVDNGELSVEFNGRLYVATPMNVTVDHIRVPVDPGSDASNLTSRDLAELIGAQTDRQSFFSIVDNHAAVVGGILGTIAIIVMVTTALCIMKARSRNPTPEDHIRFANTPEDARSERGMDAHPRGMDADSVVFGQHGLHSTA